MSEESEFHKRVVDVAMTWTDKYCPTLDLDGYKALLDAFAQFANSEIDRRTPGRRHRVVCEKCQWAGRRTHQAMRQQPCPRCKTWSVLFVGSSGTEKHGRSTK